MTISDLIIKLEKAIAEIEQKKVEEQMRDFLNLEDLLGLEKKIKIGLNKLLTTLESNKK